MSIKLLLTFLLASWCITSFTDDNTNSKKLQYKDATYEEEIRTVRLYPSTGSAYDVFSPAVVPISKNTLVLEFDDLVESHEEYRVKILPCTSDWKPGQLKPLDYLYDYNEFMVNKFEYSTDTKIGYVHYRFKVPAIKLPGNYLLVAYRGTDEKDIILTKRFMIVSQLVSIAVTSDRQGLTSINRSNQQIDFIVDHENYELINPVQNISVVLRQNQQWHNTITDLQPSGIRQHQLEYRFFNYENNFPAGNEYRFFDMRSLRYPGQNVQNVDLTKRPSEANLMPDGPRIYQAYAQYEDINGHFYISNLDTGGSSESDYLYTTFSLAMKQPVAGEIYVVGQMNNYDMNDRSKMVLNKKTGLYQNTQLLKQGFYNYKYLIKNDTLSNNYLEGDHFETENNYEIFVYYSPPGLRGDLLVGYQQLTINPRNN